MTKKISQKQYAELKQLVQSGVWKNSDVRLASILSRCKYLGMGCGRTTYEVHVADFEPVAFKFASRYSPNGFFGDGVVQNKNEVDVYRKFGDHEFVPRFFDWDDVGFTWIEVELLTRIQPRYIPRYNLVCKFARLTGLAVYELERDDHWGRDRAGRPKVIDMGISEEARACRHQDLLAMHDVNLVRTW